MERVSVEITFGVRLYIGYKIVIMVMLHLS